MAGTYVEALRACGAVIEDDDAEYFGSYQGDILVKATFGGVTGFLRIGYGSCSYCDAAEAALGWDLRPECSEHYNGVPECPDCQSAKARYDEALRAFGIGYLDDMKSAADILSDLIEQAEWDSDAQSMIDWVVARA